MWQWGRSLLVKWHAGCAVLNGCTTLGYFYCYCETCICCLGCLDVVLMAPFCRDCYFVCDVASLCWFHGCFAHRSPLSTQRRRSRWRPFLFVTVYCRCLIFCRWLVLLYFASVVRHLKLNFYNSTLVFLSLGLKTCPFLMAHSSRQL